MAIREAALSKRENSWALNTSYYLNHIGRLECRLKVLDQHFYKDFQMSLEDWEAGGCQSLLDLMGLPPRVALPLAPMLSEYLLLLGVRSSYEGCDNTLTQCFY